MPSVATSLPPFVTARALSQQRVVHGFFGRQGGVSDGVYTSLNAGYATGDDPAKVKQNHALIAAAIGVAPSKLFAAKQCHGNTCVVADGETDFATTDADALVTATPGVGVGILTGDCVPVLFAANGIVGAAHAGWGGALKGIIENTVTAMVNLGAERKNITAAIGPCIGSSSYEVSEGFEKPFLAEDAESEKFFKSTSKPGKLMFDLPGYCAWRLARAGITHVEMLGLDTLALEDTYFSHRRTTMAGGNKRGLQLSAIALKERG